MTTENEVLRSIINTLNENGHSAELGGAGLTMNKQITVDGIEFSIPGSCRGDDPEVRP